MRNLILLFRTRREEAIDRAGEIDMDLDINELMIMREKGGLFRFEQIGNLNMPEVMKQTIKRFHFESDAFREN